MTVGFDPVFTKYYTTSIPVCSNFLMFCDVDIMLLTTEYYDNKNTMVKTTNNA